MDDAYTLFNGDCLDILPTFEAGSVDAIITDLPYGTTACAWDTIIPFEPMWAGVKRVLKPSGVFVTTASQPFTSALVMSNLEWFKYEWIWRKTRKTGHLHSKNKPLKEHENVVVFSGGSMGHEGLVHNRMIYNPQYKKGDPYTKKNYVETKHKWGGTGRPSNHDYTQRSDGNRFPSSVIEYDDGNLKKLHETQKPVELMEYLIKTYTNEGDTVLDFCMGSGTTGVACMRTGRNFIGIELGIKHFSDAEARIKNAAGDFVVTDKEKLNGKVSLFDLVHNG